MITHEMISQVGFPIAVVIYLLWVQQTTIKENTKAMNKLNIAVTKLEAKMD